MEGTLERHNHITAGESRVNVSAHTHSVPDEEGSLTCGLRACTSPQVQWAGWAPCGGNRRRAQWAVGTVSKGTSLHYLAPSCTAAPQGSVCLFLDTNRSHDLSHATLTMGFRFTWTTRGQQHLIIFFFSFFAWHSGHTSRSSSCACS